MKRESISSLHYSCAGNPTCFSKLGSSWQPSTVFSRSLAMSQYLKNPHLKSSKQPPKSSPTCFCHSLQSHWLRVITDVLWKDCCWFVTATEVLFSENSDVLAEHVSRKIYITFVSVWFSSCCFLIVAVWDHAHTPQRCFGYMQNMLEAVLEETLRISYVFNCLSN